MDIIILHTAHEEFHEIDFSSYSGVKIILDGRNFFEINDHPEDNRIIKI
jgi:UDP-N-acetyl-D-mannosaminuronate dehydrogenase